MTFPISAIADSATLPTYDLLLFGDLPPERLVSFGRDVSIDVETTGLTWEDKLLGTSISWWQDDGTIGTCYLLEPRAGRMPLFGHRGIWPSSLITDLMETNAVVMHNHAFDYRVLFKEYGAEPVPDMHDTLHLAKQLEPQDGGLSLEALVHRYIKEPLDPRWGKMKEQRANLGRLAPETVAEYGQIDVKYQLMLHRILRERMATTPMDKYRPRDQRFMKLVMGLVAHGIPVDQEYCERLSKDFTRRAMEINQGLVKHRIINPTSPDDVMGYANVHPEVHIGNTEEATLAASGDPVLADVVRFRQLTKAVSSWLEPLISMSSMDGYLHSRLDPFGTVSFRMSSSNINAQGLPMEERGREFGSMMGVFKSKIPGYSIWALDLKQAEVRLAAVLAGDTDLIRVLNTEGDPYAPLAVSLWNDKNRRPDAKRAMLSSIYEIGPNSYSTKYGVSEERARAELDQVKGKFPTLRKRAIARRRFVEQMRYSPTCIGRPRWFNSIEVQKEAYKGFNQEVQGSLAEVMGESMLRTSEAFPNQLIHQVHDSMVVYLPDDPIERGRQIVAMSDIMAGSVQDLVENQRMHNLPFPVDAKPWQIMD